MKCLSCGSVFEDDEYAIETDMHGFDYGPGEEYRVCPHCRSTGIREAKLCDGCDNYFAGQYVETAHGYIYCEDCFAIRDTDYI